MRNFLIFLTLMFLFVQVSGQGPPLPPHSVIGRVFLSDGSIGANVLYTVTVTKPDGTVRGSWSKVTDQNGYISIGILADTDDKVDVSIATDTPIRQAGKFDTYTFKGNEIGNVAELGSITLSTTSTATIVPTTIPPKTITTTVAPTTIEPEDTVQLNQVFCGDGIKNAGETGVDCGGPCEPCKEGISKAMSGGNAWLIIVFAVLVLVLAAVGAIALFLYLSRRRKL